MGLFSDVDWVIIVAVAAFLLFGRENAQFVRTLGKWYARAVRLKQEMLSEVSKAADFPIGAMNPPSVRAALLGLDAEPPRWEAVPVAVAVAHASAVPNVPSAPGDPWTGGSPILSWSVTGGAASGDGLR
ncbi:MAG: hypothetical protein WBG19_05750 [Thermoplasmata archaeon]